MALTLTQSVLGRKVVIASGCGSAILVRCGSRSLCGWAAGAGQQGAGDSGGKGPGGGGQ